MQTILFFCTNLGRTWEILKSYLLNRVQKVELDGIISKPEKITFGVSQGTVLESLLVTLYVNSIKRIITKI